MGVPDRFLCCTSDSLIKRTNMILHKIQLQSFCSSLFGFHLSHIDECTDFSVASSWLDKIEDCIANIHFYQIPWFQQKTARTNAKAKSFNIHIFLELNNLTPTLRELLSQITGELLRWMVFNRRERRKKCHLSLTWASASHVACFPRLIFLIHAWRMTLALSMFALLVV